MSDFNLPVQSFVDVCDYTANKDLSRVYFDGIHAPVKGFYLFENPVPIPLFKEPGKATEILLEDVLRKSNTPADARWVILTMVGARRR